MLKGAVLYAKDLTKLRDFYLALGGKVTDGDGGDYVVITSQVADLIVLQTPEHISSQIEISKPPKVRSGTPVKPIIEVLSMNQARKVVDAAGGSVLSGADQWEFRGNLVQDIVDPEGNVVQLWQPT